MKTNARKIAPCLWFDDRAEEAARFYVSIFKNSRVGRISRYGKEGFEVHGRPAGSVLVVEFTLDGQPFTALNGGPVFTLSEAVSLQVFCDTQKELDYFWEKLSAGGDERAQQCGWLKDRYGLSWQILPRKLSAWMADPRPERSGRAMKALLRMKKLDLAKLQRAYEGKPAKK